jgi:predicted dienelactone hydrolase
MRTLLWRLVVVGVVLAVAPGWWLPAPAAQAAPDPTPRLSLPAPTDPHRVGTTSLHLVDDSRIDPLAPTSRVRELMVRLWYPAGYSSSQGRQPAAAYLTPGVNSVSTDFLRAVTGLDLPTDLLSFPAHGVQDAPALRGARRPIVLFSHGLGVPAAINTALHEELASRGYVVAGIDHTFDTAVEDLTRVGAYGHSLGGPTVIGAMNQDRRIDAGAALDGTLRGSVSFDRPFLMMGNQHERRTDDPDWAAFFDQLRGPRLHLVIDGAEHSDLTDITVFKSTIDISVVFPTGPIDGGRSVSIQRRYLTAWFDWALRGRASPLLRSESSRFPEVDFQP